MLLTLSQAAKLLSVSHNTLRKMTDNGTIPAVRMSGRRMFKEKDLREYVNSLDSWVSSSTMKLRRDRLIPEKKELPEPSFPSST